MLKLPPDAALVIIDVQKGFDEGKLGPRNNPDLERNVADLLAAWRKAKRPVIHVRHNSLGEHGLFHPSKPGVAFKREAQPAVGEVVVTKNVHSAFIGTDLASRIKAVGAGTLVFAGIQTNYCVATTARMAGNMDFDTYVVGDACATFDQSLLNGTMVSAQLAHDLALAELSGEFATVVNTTDVVTALSQPPTAKQ